MSTSTVGVGNKTVVSLLERSGAAVTKGEDIAYQLGSTNSDRVGA